MFRKIVFIAVSFAFFAVPSCWSPAKDWAPGIAVLAGILFAVTWGNPFSRITAEITSPLLGATIVGMGFGMNLTDVLRAGSNGFLYTLIGIALGLGLGILLGKILKVSENAAYLISVGTSICGGSAIAAAAPALKAKPQDIAMASATVFALNAVALWVFPAAGHLLGFSEVQFGYWAALGIHDTSSVVGASMVYGDEALEIGTTVKLARALWIVPVTIFLTLFVAGDKKEKEIKLRSPWFIPGFIAAAALVTWLPDLIPSAAEITAETGSTVKNISRYIMILTLFLIGANLNREKLRELGFRPVIQGVSLWLILSLVWCTAIYFGWVDCVK